MRLVERQAMMPGKGIAQGVERAGTNIAEDHADRADRHLDQAGLPTDVAMRMAMARNGRGSIGRGRIPCGSGVTHGITHGIVHGETAPGRFGPIVLSGPQ